jgi:hypothetical protein
MKGKNVMARYTIYEAKDAFERALRTRCCHYGLNSWKTEEGVLDQSLRLELSNRGKTREYLVRLNQIRTENDITIKLNVIFDDFFGADTTMWPKENPYLRGAWKCLPAIEDVIFNGPATIVKWSDGTKTIVKCCEDDLFDPEKGLAMAISKKALGDLKEVKKWTKKHEAEQKAEFYEDMSKHPSFAKLSERFYELHKKVMEEFGL